jgi:uncharacterized protein
MRRNVLVDAGPLVALVNRRDEHHAWTVAQWAEIEPPLWTCEAVLSEACFLVRGFSEGPRAILHMLARGAVAIGFHLDEQFEPVAKLMEKYASVPMSLANACLVRMSEMRTECGVFTFDHDFQIYRRLGRQTIPTIMPRHTAG